ncbi:MAG: adenylosuccinate lyase [Parcubacteria group bacterium Gr01-1014_33]|nr:MAG: adenylosuccinate lyase [Parcubacteria group bacterium Gr01-1014_33]
MLKRYTLPEMENLWVREETKFESWLEVELAVLWARMKLGDLSQEAYVAISINAKIDVKRIAELEVEYDHDMIAFIVSVQEALVVAGAGQYKEEFHKGLTSYDVEDPALVVTLRRAANLIRIELEKLVDVLLEKAFDYKWTIMIARTHGQFAEPTTFGHLLFMFTEAVKRSLNRLDQVEERELKEAKISGAVGSYAGMNPDIEREALEFLQLLPARCETQILQRDRHAAFLSVLAIAASTIEQVCRTFWEMMRSEVGELEEPRGSRQRGSSAMAHKKNPILTERLMGLPRLMRAYAHVAMEDIATPEFRDISQSSVERHILPDATSLLHYMARRMMNLVKNLVIFPERMKENLEIVSCGVWATQQVRNALMESGVSYDVAYEYLQQTAFDAVRSRTSLLEILRIRTILGDDRTAESIVGEQKLRQCFDAELYIKDGINYIVR